MKDTGGQAFPVHMHSANAMTLREYYAGQALVGFLSGHTNIHLPEKMAGNCYMYADAMIEEGNKDE